ncbi:MAG: polysaccharide deacetylase family protein [Bdellovibrionales bacterium]|nr:polysaccharide deacetylase family protein [Bdellovibrionales bacterium]
MQSWAAESQQLQTDSLRITEAVTREIHNDSLSRELDKGESQLGRILNEALKQSSNASTQIASFKQALDGLVKRYLHFFYLSFYFLNKFDQDLDTAYNLAQTNTASDSDKELALRKFRQTRLINHIVSTVEIRKTHNLAGIFIGLNRARMDDLDFLNEENDPSTKALLQQNRSMIKSLAIQGLGHLDAKMKEEKEKGYSLALSNLAQEVLHDFSIFVELQKETPKAKNYAQLLEAYTKSFAKNYITDGLTIQVQNRELTKPGEYDSRDMDKLTRRLIKYAIKNNPDWYTIIMNEELPDAEDARTDKNEKQLVARFPFWPKWLRGWNLFSNWNLFSKLNLSQSLSPFAFADEVIRIRASPDSGPSGNVNGNKFPNKVWALTLDDGPHPTHTMEMVAAMNSGNISGTFFWLSKNIENYPKIALSNEISDRHVRASHSYSHANIPKLNDMGQEKEITGAVDIFNKIVKTKPRFFRCPYGACDPNDSNIRKKIAANNLVHVFWNVDSLDWQDKNPNTIFERILKQMKLSNHGIILVHDIHPQSVKAVQKLAEYYSSAENPGYVFKNLNEILEVTSN